MGATYGISFSRKLRDQGKYDEALAAADTSAARDPSDAEPMYDRGATLYCMGKYEDAVTAFARAIELDEEDGLLEEGIVDDELFETLRKWAASEPDRAPEILGRYGALMPSGSHKADVTKWLTHLAAAKV